MERRVRLLIDVLAAASCAGTLAVIQGHLHSPARPAVTLVALVVGCGWAITGWLGLKEFSYAATVTLATGIALWMLVSLVSVEVHWWHPNTTVAVALVVAGLSNAVLAVSEPRRGHS
jgi:hypothetical protein